MSVDFRDAAERHWQDGDRLHEEGRAANADHLLGLGAECALKAVMVGLGMGVRADGAPLDRHHRVHADRLWDEFLGFAHARGGARYVGLLGGSANPFADWDVGQRYHHRSTIADNAVERHKRGAQSAMQVLTHAVLDGVVP